MLCLTPVLGVFSKLDLFFCNYISHQTWQKMNTLQITEIDITPSVLNIMMQAQFFKRKKKWRFESRSAIFPFLPSCLVWFRYEMIPQKAYVFKFWSTSDKLIVKMQYHEGT